MKKHPLTFLKGPQKLRQSIKKNSIATMAKTAKAASATETSPDKDNVSDNGRPVDSADDVRMDETLTELQQNQANQKGLGKSQENNKKNENEEESNKKDGSDENQEEEEQKDDESEKKGKNEGKPDEGKPDDENEGKPDDEKEDEDKDEKKKKKAYS